MKTILLRCALMLGLASGILAQGLSYETLGDGGTTFQFELLRDYDVSAVIIETASQKRVRTLWTLKRFRAGTHSFTWDGKIESGPTGDLVEVKPKDVMKYAPRVQVSDADYAWEGTIGNTSFGIGRNAPLRGSQLGFITAVGVPGGKIYACSGGSEGLAALRSFPESNPNDAAPLLQSVTQYANYGFLAADSERLYGLCTGSSVAGYAIDFHVRAWNLADESNFTFAPRGPALEASPYLITVPSDLPYADGTFPIHARTAAGTAAPVGFAVQQTGDCMAIAYADGNVSVFHKTILVRYGSNLIPGVKRLAFDAEDRLWALVAGDAVRLEWNQETRTLTPQESIDLGGQGIEMACSVQSPMRWAFILAGNKQQVKVVEHGSNGYQTVNTIGQEGGYLEHGPDVTTDKFAFSASEPIPLTFSRDGTSVWFGELRPAVGGTGRFFYYGVGPGVPTGTYLGATMFLPKFYAMTADGSTRKFCYYLEFACSDLFSLRDGPVLEPTAPGGPWRLKRNWYWAMPPGSIPNNDFPAGFREVGTFTRNGVTKTLAKILRAVDSHCSIVVLNESGSVTDTGVHFRDDLVPGQIRRFWQDDGDIYSVDYGGTTQKVYRLSLTEFVDGKPRWESLSSTQISDSTVALGTLIAQSPTSVLTPVVSAPIGDGRLGILPGNLVATSNGFTIGNQQTQGARALQGMFRLGMMNPVGTSGDTWRWSGMKGMTLANNESIVDNLQLGQAVEQVGSGIVLYVTNHNGSIRTDYERILFVNAIGFGEGAGGARTQLHAYDLDGHQLAQFGISGTTQNKADDFLTASAAHPAPAWQFAVGRLSRGGHFVCQSDEANHGGIHHWRVVGLDAGRRFSGFFGRAQSEQMMIEPSPLALPPPNNLAARLVGPGQIRIKWTPELPGSYVQIELGSHSCGPYVPRNVIPDSDGMVTCDVGGLGSKVFVVARRTWNPNSLDEADFGPLSSQLICMNFDPTQNVHFMGEAPAYEYFTCQSLYNPAVFPHLVPLSLTSEIWNRGTLVRRHLGADGFSIFNADGLRQGTRLEFNGTDGSVTFPTPSEMAATGLVETQDFGGSNSLRFIGDQTVFQCGPNANAGTSSSGSFTIQFADPGWRLVTVMVSGIRSTRQSRIVTVSVGTESVSREVVDPSDRTGYGAFYQFAVRGSPTITISPGSQSGPEFYPTRFISGVFVDRLEVD